MSYERFGNSYDHFNGGYERPGNYYDHLNDSYERLSNSYDHLNKKRGCQKTTSQSVKHEQVRASYHSSLNLYAMKMLFPVHAAFDRLFQVLRCNTRAIGHGTSDVHSFQ